MQVRTKEKFSSTQGSISRTVRSSPELNQELMFHRLSHPGAPENYVSYTTIPVVDTGIPVKRLDENMGRLWGERKLGPRGLLSQPCLDKEDGMKAHGNHSGERWGLTQ